MLEQVKRFINDEEGMGTVEIVVILAVLVSIALIFRNQIITFVRDTLSSILSPAQSNSKVETK